MKKPLSAASKILLLLMLFSNLSAVKAQNNLQVYLSDLVDGKTSKYSGGLNAYANAEYAKAYEILKKNRSKEVPYLREFTRDALLYQRSNKMIQKALATSSIELPAQYKFYLKHPEMKLKLDKNTASADLSNNLFTATLNDLQTITILLDTGGSGVGISEKLVNKYGLKKDTTISVKGSLPAFNVTFFKHPVIIPKISVGGMELTGIYAEYSVADPESKGKYNGPDFDVIMGLDTFIGYLDEVTFDWETKKITFIKNSENTGGKPFLFYDSKPFTSFQINNEDLTALVDTGSNTDILRKNIYLRSYTKKEEKTYKNYAYNEYTVELKPDDLTLKIGDHTDNLNLVIGDEKIDLILGYKHRKASFNLKNNRLRIK